MARLDKMNPDCGQCGAPFMASGFGKGYGVRPDGMRICYACCADNDRKDMVQYRRATLYLVKRGAGHYVTNWPGTLSFPVTQVQRFRHPFAREAWLAYFKGPDGKLWSAKNIGDSQIAHCRALKNG